MAKKSFEVGDRVKVSTGVKDGWFEATINEVIPQLLSNHYKIRGYVDIFAYSPVSGRLFIANSK